MGLADFFVKRFKEKGGSILLDQSYVAGDIDFKSQLTTIREQKPDVIFVPGLLHRSGTHCEAGPASWGSRSPSWAEMVGILLKLYEIGGAALDGCYFSSHYSPESKDPKVQDFVKRYQAKYGQVPDALATLGYDAVGVFGGGFENR